MEEVEGFGRDVLGARHLSLSNVVALDAKHGNGVAVYVEP